MNARLLVAIAAALVGCGTPRPLWLKHRANVAARGLAQADGATGHVTWRVPLAGKPVCPILWSSQQYKGPDDARFDGRE